MKIPNVLLVEDELVLAEAIKCALKKMDLSFIHVSTIENAKVLPLDQMPELILLDRMLPDGDGLDFCKYLRKLSYGGCILMLTARSELDDRVEGLSTGADDYLCKPFSWEELQVRILALLRRKNIYNIQKSSNLEHQDKIVDTIWSLKPQELSILGAKGWVRLTALEYRLAEKLIQSSPQIVSREELLKDVWGFQWLPQTRTVDFFMGRLRRALEESAENPSHFLTVRGMGYRFVK